MTKILIVSEYFPPGVGGSPILMGNLFKSFPKRTCAVVSSQVQNNLSADIPSYNPAIPCGFRSLFSRFQYLRAPFIYFEALKAAKQQKSKIIFTAFPNSAYLIAAYWLAKKTKLPLHVYMHDMWEENTRRLDDRLISACYERRILQFAAEVHSITNFAADYLAKKHSIKPDVLLHTVDLEGVDFDNSEESAYEPFILFTGGIYPLMNLDTIQSLVIALENWDIKIKLVILGLGDISRLGEAGIKGSCVDLRGAVDHKDAKELQKRAAILYLPLAFESSSKVEVHTVFPTKTTDYFVAGRPILLHAPGDSYTARYARELDWAEVVSSKNPDEIRQAIARLLTDPERRQQVINGAQKAAIQRDANIISEKLQRKLLSNN